MYDFEKFPVYIAGEELYNSLIEIFNNEGIPKNLKDQLDRASSSIVLNIAEGAGKYSKRDKKNFYIIARGSANECVAILRLLKLRDFISQTEYEDYYERIYVISKMLSGLINKMLL